MKVSKPLERQIQGFQFKIQQAISIKDEEIGRLSETLVHYKSKIVEAKEEIQRINHEIEITKESRDSANRCNKAQFEAQIALRNARHKEIIKQMQAEQAEEINKLHAEFSETLENLENEISPSYSEQFELVERSRINTLKMIEQYQTTIRELTSAENSEESISESDFERREKRIHDLQNIVKMRNEERLQSLLDSKKKLTECMQMLEDIDKDHISSIAEMKKKIADMDKTYTIEINDMRDNHHHVKVIQQQKYEQAIHQYNSLRRALTKLRAGHQSQLKQSMQEMSMIKTRFAASAPVSYKTENDDPQLLESIEKNRARLRNTKELIRQREEDLRKVRQENQSLKQELGRIRHHIEYPMRVPIYC
ncbi:hypothetical protein TRFO_03447 [Tritrichomonas foetus]|uniref:Uncharacterized protein n=1 Tax=Tritrichomonas foetus TaxID=1144522 RepID=A0A1J4KPK2_9EUKA|nr:hypothetical protein TRFO_03447 [Tritrichomonas foetus]|eukprot:OHT13034.1 hypothetical protein TRFO_03447 [Tritrichomonas foetus]